MRRFQRCGVGITIRAPSAAATPSTTPRPRPKANVEATPWPGIEWTRSTLARVMAGQ
jgi:hypothetical protein